ncbi:MAG: DUF4870 domain-containing protein [Gammaproteobacteria bacterium]|nr:DUF4870 domain-containing protein [Gammaproteobacteria bacterium]
MPKQDTTQRSYMALAPLSSLAGIFINPLASTIAPLILFFIFRNSRPKVAKVALQTADLAFSIQLWIMLISLAVMLGISLEWIIAEEAQFIMSKATSIILVLFVVSLLFAVYQAVNGRTCTHIFSFKIAERVFNLINSPKSEKSTKESKDEK